MSSATNMFWRVGLVLLFWFEVSRTQPVDLTLVPDESGVDVVDASIAKLEALNNVFSNDFGFLKRIALVESSFGKNVTYLTGGIWQITPDIFSNLSDPNVQNYLATYLNPARIAFGTNVTDLTNPDFRVPLKSALAARLYVQLVGGSNVPGTINEQAIWWTNNYNINGSRQDFVDGVTLYENTTGCFIPKLDIWLLVDGSGSIGSDNFQTTLQFVANLASEFLIAPDAVRFGFSVYSSTHNFISHFNQDTNNTEFNNTVLSTSYPGGGTRTGAAINEVVMTGFNVTFGQRPLSAGVPRVLVVLTDGQSGDDVLLPSERARDEGITVYAVGIGVGINQHELLEIAGNASNRLFELDDFSQLISVLRGELTNDACMASAEIPDNTTVEVSVPPGNTYYFSVQLPNNGSVELEFFVPVGNGSGIVYISGTVTNPSSAVYDFSIKVSPGTTMITINTGDLNFGLVLAGVFSRSRRSVDDKADSKPLYVALQSTSDEPLQVGFQSTGSPDRAAVATTSMNSTPQPSSEVTQSATTMRVVPTEIATTSGASSSTFFGPELLIMITFASLLSFHKKNFNL